MRLLRKLLFGIALSCPLMGSAYAQPDELAAQRARWEAVKTDSYSYAYQKFCDCHRDEPPTTYVIVEDDTITRVYHVHSNSEREVPAREGSLELYWTIDGLFDLIASAESNAASTRARYHEELGYPLSIYIDYQADLVGEELDLRLSEIELRE